MKNPFVIAALAPRHLLSLSLLCVLLLSGCAHTDISVVNSQGKAQRIAHFEGDMQIVSFKYNDGTQHIAFTAQSVSHSAATLAQGQAADTVLGGVATAVTSTGIAVGTSGILPGGIAALIKKL